MAWGLISHRADAIGTNGGTSGALGTVGASLIVVAVGYDPRGAGLSLLDSKGNSWSLIGTANAAAFESVSMYYCANPVTDGSHTFSFGGSSSFVSMAISAYSGGAVSPLDQHLSNAGTGITNIQPGSITPTTDNQLIVTACATADAVTANSLDSGFTPSGADGTWQIAAASFVRDGISMGFLIQSSAAAVNPTWGASGSTALSAIQASFFVGPPTQPPTGGTFLNSPPRPRLPGIPGARFRSQLAVFPPPAQSDPNPASFWTSRGPMFGRGGPSPSNRFRSPQAYDPFSGNIVGQWRNVTPGGLNLDGSSFGGNNFGPLIICADPVRQNVVWFGCQEGVFKSTDFGINWGKCNFGTGGAALDSGRVWGLQIDQNINRDPTTSPRLYCVVGYASPTGNQGIWLSTDDGFSWTQKTPAFAAGFVNQVAIDPLDKLHLIASSHDDTQFAETQNGGDTWTILATASPTTGGWVSIIDRSTWLTGDITGVYRTLDSGGTWTRVTTSASAHGGQQLAKLKGGPQVYVGQDFITQRSDDYGGTWTTVENTANASVILATPTYLYKTFGFATQGTTQPTLARALRTADTSWDQNYTPTPTSMTNGGNSGTVIFDGGQYVLLYACGLAGVWRFVEGILPTAPIVTYPETPRRAPNRVFGPAPTRSFRSTLGFSAASGSGSLFFQSVGGTLAFVGDLLKLAQTTKAGTLTSSGAATKQVQTAKAGTLSSAGTIIKQAQLLKAGTLSSSGALVKLALKVLSGALTSSGAVTIIKVVVKAVGGTLTSSGAIVLRTSKGLAGTLTSAGSVVKRVNKTLAGALSSAGSVAVIRVIVKAVGGVLGLAGTLTLRTSKAVGGTLTSSGTVRKLISKSVSGVLSFLGLAVLSRPVTAPPNTVDLDLKPDEFSLTLAPDNDVTLTLS